VERLIELQLVRWNMKYSHYEQVGLIIIFVLGQFPQVMGIYFLTQGFPKRQ
jgi:hypothetical protein